ncbi:biliverdin-producing heme oxygenase [Amycolatopsis antarctica]|uniref:Biliverdin-producing heme oxygenase n=1 Tax=Amycolatopsis antarctica TaxID=1854586 RepID=A0A263CXA0_9PSEU|nr:biliverdin-producing heme oxygenase [Amycolatopsis antarctica]OZM70568.1 biliverdin-producing heme oxygenase [Amycolatopsis antarctica]
MASTTAPSELDARPFSKVLRESTRAVHEKANHSTYMDALLGGELQLADYTRLAVQYYFIYRTIEQVSDRMTGDEVGSRFVFDELRRLPSLRRDLAYLVGADWESAIEPLPATMAYCQRIREVSAEWAGGYVAHHYTRYLGDIAGGQIIRRLLENTYGVQGPGTLFYHFDRLDSAPAFRDRYRARLDAAPWSEAERERVVAETLIAFECNVAVFDELDAEIGERTHP